MRQLRWKAILIRATDLNPRDAVTSNSKHRFLNIFLRQRNLNIIGFEKR